MKKYLMHGSNCGTITVLEPRISLELTKHVYATDDYRYALVRAGKQLDLIREEYYGHDKPIELAECYPNAFELGKAYNLYGAMEGREDVTEDDMFAAWCIFMLIFDSEKSHLDIDEILENFDYEGLRDKYLR